MPVRLEARETVCDRGAPHKGCGAARNKTMGQAPLTILLAGPRGFCARAAPMVERSIKRFGFNLPRALAA